MTPADYNALLVYINTLNILQYNYVNTVITSEEFKEISRNREIIDKIVDRLLLEGDKYINLYEIHNTKIEKRKIKLLISLRFLVKKIKSYFYHENTFMENLLMFILLDKVEKIAFSQKELNELIKKENFKLAMNHYIITTKNESILFKYK